MSYFYSSVAPSDCVKIIWQSHRSKSLFTNQYAIISNFKMSTGNRPRVFSGVGEIIKFPYDPMFNYAEPRRPYWMAPSKTEHTCNF